MELGDLKEEVKKVRSQERLGKEVFLMMLKNFLDHLQRFSKVKVKTLALRERKACEGTQPLDYIADIMHMHCQREFSEIHRD